jgi:hypothetical protein
MYSGAFPFVDPAFHSLHFIMHTAGLYAVASGNSNKITRDCSVYAPSSQQIHGCSVTRAYYKLKVRRENWEDDVGKFIKPAGNSTFRAISST